MRRRIDDDMPASRDAIRALLSPCSIAIVGASADRDKFGGRLVEVLQLHGFGGTIYPINPRRAEIFGLKAYPRLLDVPGDVDVAVICVPQRMILEAVEDCAAKRVALCIIISAQFAEAGPEGQALEAEIGRRGKLHGMRILGPNCLGFINRAHKVVLIPSPALYAHRPMPAGRIGMVSQSGGLLATMFDIAVGLGLGFSYGITVGNQLDLTAADFIRFLAGDPETSVICCYLEGVKDFADFSQALAYAQQAGKPVVILKAGRTAEGGAAAFTHTASLSSDYEIFAAYAEQMGAVTVDDPRVMLIVADLLARHGATPFDDVAIVTNSGGGAAIVADRLNDMRLRLAAFGEALTDRLSEFYFRSHARNPLDWGGTELASEDELLERSFASLSMEPDRHFLLIVFLTNPDMKRTAEILARHVELARMPYLFVVIPDKAADVSREVLRQDRKPFADSIDDALRAIAVLRSHGMRRSSQSVRPFYSGDALPQVPDLPEPELKPDGTLDADAALTFLSRCDIPVVPSTLARTPEEAAAFAAKTGYPVALKLVVEGITHKADVGGVELDIGDEAALRAALQRMETSLRSYTPGRRFEGILVQPMIPRGIECFVGIKNDPAIGPVVLFGAGGTLVELLRDRAVLPVPCEREAVKRRLSELSIHKLLAGYRGHAPADIDALSDVVVRVGALAHGLRHRVLELDLNPVIVGAVGEGAVAVDARARFSRVDPPRAAAAISPEAMS